MADTKAEIARVEKEEKLKITEMSVNDLKPYEKNTKKHKDLDAANIAR